MCAFGFITGFVEYPTNITLLLLEFEIRATFRCSHRSSVVLSWLVNGSPSGYFPGAEEILTNENGTSLRGSTLTIPAIVENNGTVVMCLAIFIDGPANEETPSVTLTLMAGWLKIDYASTVNRSQCKVTTF